MTKRSRLLIDIGNTQIKLGIWSEGKLKRCQKCNHANLRPIINKYKSMTFERVVYKHATNAKTKFLFATTL